MFSHLGVKFYECTCFVSAVMLKDSEAFQPLDVRNSFQLIYRINRSLRVTRESIVSGSRKGKNHVSVIYVSLRAAEHTWRVLKARAYTKTYNVRLHKCMPRQPRKCIHRDTHGRKIGAPLGWGGGEKRIREKEREILGTHNFHETFESALRAIVLIRPRVAWLLYRKLLLIINGNYYDVLLLLPLLLLLLLLLLLWLLLLSLLLLLLLATTITTIITTYRYLYIYNCVVWSGTLWYNRLVLTPYWNWDEFNEKEKNRAILR